MYIFLSLATLACGMIMLFCPKLIFDITESWKSNSASEPSKLYIFSIRFGGIMCSLAGLTGSIFYIFFN